MRQKRFEKGGTLVERDYDTLDNVIMQDENETLRQTQYIPQQASQWKEASSTPPPIHRIENIHLPQMCQLLTIPLELILQYIKSSHEVIEIVSLGLVCKKLQVVWTSLQVLLASFDKFQNSENQDIRHGPLYTYLMSMLQQSQSYKEMIVEEKWNNQEDVMAFLQPLQSIADNCGHQVWNSIQRLLEQWSDCIEKLIQIQTNLNKYADYNEAMARDLAVISAPIAQQKQIVSNAMRVMAQRIDWITNGCSTVVIADDFTKSLLFEKTWEEIFSLSIERGEVEEKDCEQQNQHHHQVPTQRGDQTEDPKQRENSNASQKDVPVSQIKPSKLIAKSPSLQDNSDNVLEDGPEEVNEKADEEMGSQHSHEFDNFSPIKESEEEVEDNSEDDELQFSDVQSQKFAATQMNLVSKVIQTQQAPLFPNSSFSNSSHPSLSKKRNRAEDEDEHSTTPITIYNGISSNYSYSNSAAPHHGMNSTSDKKNEVATGRKKFKPPLLHKEHV